MPSLKATSRTPSQAVGSEIGAAPVSVPAPHILPTQNVGESICLTSSLLSTMMAAMRYPGGKGKTYQHIINVMPPHRVYIETHLGGGAVMRNKLPAEHNIGIDADPKVIAAWGNLNLPYVDVVYSKAEDFLSLQSFRGDELVYADPPYHPQTRRQARVYKKDYSIEDHERLISILLTLPCMVILSGYANSLYNNMLHGWTTRTFRSKSHTDVREETIWFNFEPPVMLHDPRHLGANFRQRQTAKRRLQRLQDKVARMDPIERSIFSNWLYSAYPIELGVERK